MALSLQAIERALIVGRWDESIEAADKSISELSQKVIHGDFKAVLTSSRAKSLLKIHLPGDTLTAEPLEHWFPFDESTSFSEEENELFRIVIGIACLHAFIQVNWTGPHLDIVPADLLFDLSEHTSAVLSEDALNQKAISELAYGGEPAYHLAQAAAFFRLAQLLFALPHKLCQSAAWWRLRTARIHQHILDEPVGIPPSITNSLQPLYSGLASERDLAGRLTLEHGLLEHHFGQDKHASELFVRAARYTGLDYELTGALGKRTKFQQTDLSQLVLLAESRSRDRDEEKSETLMANDHADPAAIRRDPRLAVRGPSAPPSFALPETLALEDDTLLEQTVFTSSSVGLRSSRLSHLDPSSQPSLHPLDQCLLLSLCLNVKNTSPTHGLTTEQMAPYVQRVISHPQNWSIHTMALLLRSRLESSRTRTVERSTLQLQALVDQMPTADASLSERLLYFHSLPMPSKWEFEHELAMRFLSLGVVRSAKDIFERLEMWEEVVQCWQSMERQDKGIAIVRDLLEGRKEESEAVVSRGKASMGRRRQVLNSAREAKLWCLLGDLEPGHALEHYERAWEISRRMSGRAMRSMGGYYFARENYTRAIECLRKAVEINPLLSRPWFILGCSYVREERWREARDVFGRCVAIDDEDGESWNNLASVYLRMGASDAEPNGGNGDGNEARNDVGEEGGAADVQPLTIPFENKLLAFRALRIGLKYSYENWRMWTNYMIVAMDVGEFAEACRAQARVVEERSTKVGAEAVDEDLLDRLVDAVTRATSKTDGVESEPAAIVTRSPNEGSGLLPRVADLFERTILPRVSSQRIFRAYARLLTWQERWSDAVKSYLDAYRASAAATMEKGGEVDEARWMEAVREVEDIIDVLRNFGPRAGSEVDNLRESIHGDGAETTTATVGGVGAGYRWEAQARSILRTFMARTRDSFVDDPYWEKLTQLQEELKN